MKHTIYHRECHKTCHCVVVNGVIYWISYLLLGCRIQYCLSSSSHDYQWPQSNVVISSSPPSVKWSRIHSPRALVARFEKLILGRFIVKGFHCSMTSSFHQFVSALSWPIDFWQHRRAHVKEYDDIDFQWLLILYDDTEMIQFRSIFNAWPASLTIKLKGLTLSSIILRKLSKSLILTQIVLIIRRRKRVAKLRAGQTHNNWSRASEIFTHKYSWESEKLFLEISSQAAFHHH